MSQIYNHHVFFCTHERNDGKAFCEQHNASELRAYAKQRVKELNLKKVRINNAGCLNRCGVGPVMVIYPEGHGINIKLNQTLMTLFRLIYKTIQS